MVPITDDKFPEALSESKALARSCAPPGGVRTTAIFALDSTLRINSAGKDIKRRPDSSDGS
jgi:hypothetical protein